jgi:hypothetical protein
MPRRDLAELAVIEVAANIRGILKIAHAAPSVSDAFEVPSDSKNV